MKTYRKLASLHRFDVKASPTSLFAASIIEEFRDLIDLIDADEIELGVRGRFPVSLMVPTPNIRSTIPCLKSLLPDVLTDHEPPT
ncbi:MAG: hypothetical protein U0905_00665 [Pirellulales bacterium]